MANDNGSGFITAYRGTVYPWQCDHMGHMNRHVVCSQV
jgi:hypothetical protein